jgi:hypothetical protein
VPIPSAAPEPGSVLPPSDAGAAAILQASDPARGTPGDDGQTVYGPFLGLGAPHPISLGIRLRLDPRWSFEVDGGLLRLGLTHQRAIGISHFQGTARWSPWGGVFHVGMHLGYQNISFSTTIPTTEQIGILRITSLFATPHVGWDWRYRSGITLGVGLGWQFPFLARGDVGVPSSVFKDAEQEDLYYGLKRGSKRALQRLGSLPLPYVTLFRIGYLF